MTFSITFSTSDEIWYKKFITKRIWKCHIQTTTKFSRLQCNTHGFLGSPRQSCSPISRRHFEIHFLIWNCFIFRFFFQILLQCDSKFPNTNLVYYFIILHWDLLHRIASWFRNVFPNTVPMWEESNGHRWIPAQRASDRVCFMACVKRLLPANDKLTVVWFRVGYVILRLANVIRK